MKNNFERFQEMLLVFFGQNGVNISINLISLHEASKNDADKHYITYFYDREEMPVLDMDEIAKKPYREARVLEEFEDTKDDIVNTADGFVINKDNQWFLIEFKDTKIAGTKKSLKDNIIKKAYCNWYMLMDAYVYTEIELEREFVKKFEY